MEATLRPYDRGEEVTPFATLGLYHALPCPTILRLSPLFAVPILRLPWAEKWNGASDPRGENRRRGESKARGNEAEARPSRRIHGIYTPTSRRKVQLVTRRARNNGSTIVGPQLHVQRADLACLCFTSSPFEIPGACGAACQSAQPCRLWH